MRQTTDSVLMIRPRCFGPNPQTAQSNVFQQACDADPEALRIAACAEFDGLARAMQDAGVHVLVAADTESPSKPDAVFPNNWVSFHENGDVVLYPLQAPNRRPERRLELVEWLAEQGGFRASRLIDLSWLEQHGAFLEGTGSLVLDRPNHLAYAALSGRTQPAALAELARQTGLEILSFETRDETGVPYYHTNVMLSLGRDCAVVCAEAIDDRRARDRVLGQLAKSGRTIIDISRAQVRRFAANVLEVATAGGGSRMVMSVAARDAFAPEQLQMLGELAPPLAVPLDTIERVGGGGARCMLAEVFLTPVAPQPVQ